MSCAKRRSFFLHARITLGPHTQRRQGNASRQTATCTLKIKHRFLADDRPEEDSRRVGALGVDYCGRGIAVTVAHSLFSPLLAAAAAAVVVVVVVAAAARARARARAGRATESAPRARRTTSASRAHSASSSAAGLLAAAAAVARARASARARGRASGTCSVHALTIANNSHTIQEAKTTNTSAGGINR